MATRAIAVNERYGHYDIVLGAHPQLWGTLIHHTRETWWDVDIEIVEPLTGWYGWEWTIRLNGSYMFIGRTNQDEEWPEEIKEAFTRYDEEE